MAKTLRRFAAQDIADALQHGDTELLQTLCPCRTHVLDREVWHEVFATMQNGGRRARHRAAHAIATLMHKAQTSGQYRSLLRDLDDELAKVMQDPRARSSLVGQVAHQAGHARTLKRDGLQTVRHQSRVLDLTTKHDLVDWVNGRLGLARHQGVSAADPGLDRLWRWMSHRTEFQHRRRLTEDNLLQKAAQWLPGYFTGPSPCASKVG